MSLPGEVADLLARVPFILAGLAVVGGLVIALASRLPLKRLLGLGAAQIGVGVLAAFLGGAGSLGRVESPAAGPLPAALAMIFLTAGLVSVLIGAILIAHSSDAAPNEDVQETASGAGP